MLILLDYETKSFSPLPDVGAWVYSEHPTTDIFCMAYIWEGMEKPALWVPGDTLPSEFYKKGAKFIARNALFEHAISTNVAIKKYGFPESMAEPGNWLCTAAMSRAVGMPGSLGKCAKALGVSEKLETGTGLIRKYSIPAKDRKTGELYFNELKGEDLRLMHEYCIQDVVADWACFNILKNIDNNKTDYPVFRLDFKQNITGICVDVNALDKILYELNIAFTMARAEADKLSYVAIYYPPKPVTPLHKTLDLICREKGDPPTIRTEARVGINVNSPKQIKEFLLSHGIDAPDSKISTIDKIYDSTDNAEVKRVLTLRKFLGKASIKKFQALKDRVSSDGRLRHAILYHGAGTGRFSARGFQPHNLPKTETTPDEITELIKSFNSDLSRPGIIDNAQRILPGLLIAGKGHKFIMGDFSAIEARVIAYLSGEKWRLDVFKTHGKIYEASASAMFNVPIESIGKDSPLRKKGKIAELALGYQGSVGALTQMGALNMGLKESELKTLTDDWRKANRKIVAFWYDLQNGFEKAFCNKCIVKVGRLSIEGKKKFVSIQLPSGRKLYYHGVKIEGREITFFNHARGGRFHLYGGLLAENVTQAVARDILTDCMLRMNKQGLTPLFHVHDEIICQEPIDKVDEHAKIFNEVSNTPPSWLPGFPLATDLEICERYHK